MRIAVIGAGGWGTANAMLLSGYGHDVVVWGRSPEYVDEIRRTRENPRYLKGVQLPERIRWTSDREEAADGAEAFVLAVPSRHFASACASFRAFVPPGSLVVSLTKGLCEKTHARMSEIARRELGVSRVVVLSGPSHAEEVSRGVPTAVVAASDDPAAAKRVQEIWNGPTFRVYTSDDPIGVEVGGAVKNVIAVAVGCSDGLGFGDNTRAALMTRGIAELARFAAACGANPRTASGLSGVGDLIVTCTSRHSRNRAVGERLGRGEKLSEIVGSMRMVAEGVWNAETVHALAAELGVEMPICDLVWRVCREDFPVREAIGLLMNRSAKSE